MDTVREEFRTRVGIHDAPSLRRFFFRHAFFSSNDLAQILGLSAWTIRQYKKRAGIQYRNSHNKLPPNLQLPVHLDLPGGWDTAEWWRAHYPRYGMHILVRETGLGYRTVRRRVQKHCGGIRSHQEATHPTHPCCNEEWLREHYIDQGLSQKRCGVIAGVSDYTIRNWLVRYGIQVRGHYGGSLLDKVSSV